MHLLKEAYFNTALLLITCTHAVFPDVWPINHFNLRNMCLSGCGTFSATRGTLKAAPQKSGDFKRHA